MPLAELIDTFRGPLVGLIAAWGASWVDANEIAQDSFSEAYLRRSACRGDWRDPAVFGPWLRGVARNVHRNRGRADRRRRLRIVASDKVVQAAAAPIEMAAATERVLALRDAIERLPAKQRAVVLMHYLEETRVADVAALLGVTAKAVEGRLYQARRTLTRLLGEAPARTEVGRVLLCL